MQQCTIQLVVTAGPNEGDIIPVAVDRFLIGRDSGCDFRPAGEGVAERHCVVLARGGRFFLRNLQLPHGTWVGGRYVLGAMELCDGDHFQVGEWQLQVQIARCPDLIVEPDYSPSEQSAGADPVEASGDVTWVSSSLGGTSEFFAVCGAVFPSEELPAGDPSENAPLPPPAEEPAESIGAEGTACDAEGERSSPCPSAVQTQWPPNGTAETSGELASIHDPAPLMPSAQAEGFPVAEERVPEEVLQDGTSYLCRPTEEAEPNTAEGPAADDATAVPASMLPASCSQSLEPRYSNREAGRPDRTESTDRLPARPSIIIGRKDHAMPLLRQRAWNAANQPVVVVRPGPPSRTWKSWPALGGVVVGMVLVSAFYLTTVRAAPAPLQPPPRGRLHTGRAVIRTPQASLADVEQRPSPRSDGPRTPNQRINKR